MKKTLLLMLLAAMALSTQAKDIRVVEISTGSGIGSAYYDSSARKALATLAGVSKIVTDVANLVLTITYDADVVCVDDIVAHINKHEPRFEARPKGEPKTPAWVKAEKKRDKAEKRVEKERKEANERDQQRQAQGKGGKK